MKSMGQRLRYGVKTGRRPKLDGSRDCGRNSLRQPEVEAGSTFQPIHSTGPEARLPLDRKRSPIHFAKIFFHNYDTPTPYRYLTAKRMYDRPIGSQGHSSANQRASIRVCGSIRTTALLQECNAVGVPEKQRLCPIERGD